MADVATSKPPSFPMARGCPLDPPPGYAEIAAQHPISKVTLPTGKIAWLIMGHEYFRQIMADPRVSVNRADPGYPHLVDVGPAALGPLTQINNALVGLDPPQHTVHRRLLINEFTIKRIQRLRPRVQEIVDSRIDALLEAGPPADLVELVSLPIPSMVICELLGVPYEDHTFFQNCTQTAFSRSTKPDERITAAMNLLVYIDQLVRKQEQTPDDEGLLGRLVVRYREADLYDHNHMVGLVMLLLMAGFETTANMITMGTLSLIEHPDQLALVKSDPAMAANAVEELLRYLSITDISAGSRVALEDIEIGGVTIRKGDGLIAMLSGANRDSAQFPDADVLDVTRGARQHVAFGHGVHQCLGQNLARMELEIVYQTLFTRVSGLRLAVPISEIPFKDEASIYGAHKLPVAW